MMYPNSPGIQQGYPPQDYRSELTRARDAERRALGKNVTMLGILLVAYNVFNKLFVRAYYFAAYAYLNHSVTLDLNTAVSYVRENGLLNSSAFTMTANLSIVVCSALMLLIIAGPIMRIGIWDMAKPYKGFIKDGAKWSPLGITFNILVGLVAGVITAMLNESGVTVPTADFSIKSPSHAAIVMQLLYVCLVGPFVEELVYRGLIIKLLAPYGRLLSVFMSALIFGIMHGNIAQALSAFGGGLIYAMITVRYNSIAPTLIMHIINNTIASVPDFADAVGYKHGSDISLTIEIVLLFLGFYAIFVMLSQLFIQIRDMESRYVLHTGERMTVIFTNVFMIIYFVIIAVGYITSFVRANKGGG